jgi:NAD(P)-dependent dehydrogenase (short-subunit alcohol dehydrogenase family)
MKEFSGRIAVVTGGGSGMGPELVRLLVAEGCHVALCEVAMRVTAHLVDVPNEADAMRFRDGHRLHRISRAGLPRPLPGISLGTSNE